MKKKILLVIVFICGGSVAGALAAVFVQAILPKNADSLESTNTTFYSNEIATEKQSETTEESSAESMTGWAEDLCFYDTDLEYELWLPKHITLAKETIVPFHEKSGAWGLEVADYSYTDFMKQSGYQNDFYGFDGVLYGGEHYSYLWKDPESKVQILLPSFGGDPKSGEIIEQTQQYQIARLKCERSFLEETVSYELWVISWNESLHILLLPVECASKEEIMEIASASMKTPSQMKTSE